MAAVHGGVSGATCAEPHAAAIFGSAATDGTIAADDTHTRNLSDHHPFGVANLRRPRRIDCEGELMNGLIYLVGLIVVIMAILSLFGLR